MALKSTIHKVELQIANMDRGYYANHAVTIAKHPSETDERMMVRLLAYALCASDRLAFGKGISDTDEPDLWERDLTGAIERWIEVGLPDERRLPKAAGRSREVVVYAYGGRAVLVWWGEIESKLARLSNVTVFGVPAEASRGLEALARRTMKLRVEQPPFVRNGKVLV